ncbi:TetR/AcrR family transcriptional regulator [Actinoplanes sp. ATCC 53533]|uniref:TetR/AcrR family transcriptional regulator n=1 Tax=Actinoplanes sp. ATCC 53533 TaxID=1288362 RepID=UPI000F789CC6|nr:TetR/AcrR family transcriptional regulator [Actinoplanes sp. ATCC 53533]RSM65515.1 TetR/AcrR family transcriptional regulator [Actinoplanes sp. ATCC 53533]
MTGERPEAGRTPDGGRPRAQRKAAAANGSRSRRDRAVSLSADLIVDRALELTEREGAAVLTMRRLGEELGVDPTAVYRYFRDKDELVLACLDRIIDNAYAAIEPTLDRADWRGVLRAVADQSWRSCEAHPAIYSLAFFRTTGGPGERKMVELLLSTLAAAGLSPEQAVLHYRAYVDSMLAMCGMKAASQSLDPQLREKDTSAWTRIYAILPQQQYPAARAHATHLAEVTERAIFAAVTDSVIALIEEALRD